MDYGLLWTSKQERRLTVTTTLIFSIKIIILCFRLLASEMEGSSWGEWKSLPNGVITPPIWVQLFIFVRDVFVSSAMYTHLIYYLTFEYIAISIIEKLIHGGFTNPIYGHLALGQAYRLLLNLHQLFQAIDQSLSFPIFVTTSLYSSFMVCGLFLLAMAGMTNHTISKAALEMTIEICFTLSMICWLGSYVEDQRLTIFRWMRHNSLETNPHLKVRDSRSMQLIRVPRRSSILSHILEPREMYLGRFKKLEHHSLLLDGCGFFSINKALFVSCLAIGITYSVILIQSEVSLESRRN